MNDIICTFRANVAYAISNEMLTTVGGGTFTHKELQSVLDFLSMTPVYEVYYSCGVAQGWEEAGKSMYDISHPKCRRIVYVKGG